MPTDEQLIRMDEKKLKDVKEESELRLGSSFLFLLSLSDQRRVAPKAGGEARSAQSWRG